MERLRNIIWSICGGLILLSLVGCLILTIEGDYETSLFYVDLGVLSLVIGGLAPIILSRIDDPNTVNKSFFFVTTIVWTGSIIAPFILIGMKEGRLVLLGIFLGIITLLIFLLKIDKRLGANSNSKKISTYFFLILFCSPFIYALLLWSDSQLTGMFFLLVAVNLLIYIEIRTASVLQAYEAKKHWIPIKIKYPEIEPVLVFNRILSIQYPEHLKVDFVEARVCELEAVLHYQIEGIYYENNNFRYNWIAPFDDRLKAFNYHEQLKGKWMNLIYDPENPMNLSVSLVDKAAKRERISACKAQKKKYQMYALGIAILGFFLFLY